MLLDSNILIYASKASPFQDKATEFLCNPEACISAITYLEVLGYHKLGTDEKAAIEAMISRIEMYPISNQIIQMATELRQQKSISLGDAIIAATALHYQQPIVTANVQDFKYLEGIQLINPLEK
ncbi:type II toxin-antitoxin system VapC family toxin [Leucothrix pacifica]|uniref:PIN domain-containing protein n=1 Tax=Leucothrix pacifica TaxID=1247513 RepID=A0A317C913_9GAMM|nr:type II toxin-antitoxin system VapC family toxin [Leucothrix pacifica]PWQ92830.1 hypothetical protein DKW60_18985 [Leucothrix pacifica]